MQLERNEEGVAVIRRAVADGVRIMGHEDVITAGAKNMLGIALVRCSKYEEALPFLDEGTKFLETRLTEGDDNTRSALNILRLYSEKLEKYDDALRHAYRHANMTNVLYGGQGAEATASQVYIARHLTQLGRHGEALGVLARVEKDPSRALECAAMIAACHDALGKGEMGEV